jgi:hypothetical protein
MAYHMLWNLELEAFNFSQVKNANIFVTPRIASLGKK